MQQRVNNLKNMIEAQGCTILNDTHVKRVWETCQNEDNALHLFMLGYEDGTVPREHIQRLDYFEGAALPQVRSSIASHFNDSAERSQSIKPGQLVEVFSSGDQDRYGNLYCCS